MAEQNAIARLKNGDIGGLEVLVTKYQEQAVRTAYLIVRDRTVALDVAQTAFIRAYDHIGQFDISRPFAPWFFRIVINLAIRAAHNEARTISFESEDFDYTCHEQISLDELTPENITEQADSAQQLWSLLKQLSPEQRAVIVMRYYVGLKNVDIAHNLNIPSGTVRWRLHTALVRLRGLLKQYGWKSPGVVDTPDKEEIAQ
jgi:RNA polymerase sigma-70 factor, ECF subfamily